MDDVELKREFSVDGEWFRWVDPRPMEKRNADPTRPSRTVHGLWVYGPDEALELHFVSEPKRGFLIRYRGERIGFSPEIHPEPVMGASINRAKREAVRLSASLKNSSR